jgi:hypothetical protein
MGRFPSPFTSVDIRFDRFLSFFTSVDPRFDRFPFPSSTSGA